MIRKVNTADAEEITAIYNYYILNSTATLEIDPIDVSEMKNRIEHIIHTEKLPFYVFEERGEIIGYAYATTWRKRIGYRYSVESSVYLKQGTASKGIGTLLYMSVIDNLRDQGYKNVIGVLTLPNDPSVAFHEKLGFTQAGYFEGVGRKFDEWKDVGFWQLKI